MAPIADEAEPQPEGPLPENRLPEPLRQTPPAFPLAMKMLEIEGTVLVEFVVAPTGRVADVRALQSTLAAFDRAAISAVRQWRFKPGVKEGHAVSTRIQAPVVFVLDEAASAGVQVEFESRNGKR